MRFKDKIFAGVLVSFFFYCFTLPGLAQSSVSGKQKISILFIGDIMGHDEQIWSAENRETHTFNYDEVFSLIKPVISEADIAIANFEVTLAGPPYKGYPQFSSPPALAVACRNAGIDYLVTANNHSADRGRGGIEGTINRLDSIGMPHTGTFLSHAAKEKLQPLIMKKEGISVALLNYTYGTNGIKVPEPAMVNMLVKEAVTRDVEKAKALNPDFIVLFLHWGTEYDTIPSQSQVDIAHYFLSKGADLIIGSHPHVLQKMVWYKDDPLMTNKAIVYSLGNFVTNQRKPKTDGGSMVRIELIKENDSVRITNAGFYLTWVYTPIVKYRKKFFILPCSAYENKPEFFTNPADYIQMKKFIDDSRELLYKQNINVPEISYNGNVFTVK
jgi:poly-gamma-glutamate synthesis protein (capsule biosynthesis protein)